jgi:ABC-type sugar transport system substrate-binding protein
MKITVCGSIAFYSEMEKLKAELEENDHEVLIPLLNEETSYGNDRKIYFAKYIEENGGIDAFSPIDPIWISKQNAMNDHFQKIEWADAIVVANHEKRGVKGYIGGNTLIEIGLAFYLKKDIYILNPISSDISYKQEIYGMKPVLLNGKLDLLKTK